MPDMLPSNFDVMQRLAYLYIWAGHTWNLMNGHSISLPIGSPTPSDTRRGLKILSYCTFRQHCSAEPPLPDFRAFGTAWINISTKQISFSQQPGVTLMSSTKKQKEKKEPKWLENDDGYFYVEGDTDTLFFVGTDGVYYPCIKILGGAGARGGGRGGGGRRGRAGGGGAGQ